MRRRRAGCGGHPLPTHGPPTMRAKIRPDGLESGCGKSSEPKPVNAAARRIAATCCCRVEAPATEPLARAERPPFPDRGILVSNDPGRASQLRNRQILLAAVAREPFAGLLAPRPERAQACAVCEAQRPTGIPPAPATRAGKRSSWQSVAIAGTRQRRSRTRPATKNDR